jgi:hypothetical protein
MKRRRTTGNGCAGSPDFSPTHLPEKEMPRYTTILLLTVVLLFMGCSSGDKNPQAPNIPGPTDLRATTLTSTTVRLQWRDNSENESGFRVERAPLAGNTWTVLPDLPANAVTFTDTGLTEGSLFKYRVKAFIGATNSIPTDDLPVVIPLESPGTTLTATRISTTSIGLAWSDLSTAEMGYQIERKPRGGTYGLVKSLNAGAVAHTDTGLTPSTTYYYRVRAAKDTIYSLWSSERSAATTVYTPPAPSELAASTRGAPNTVSLTWADNSANEDGFEIEMSLSEFNGWAIVDSAEMDVTRLTVRNLESQTFYFFRMRAYNSHGYSSYSNLVSVEVIGPPAAPTQLSGEAVSWRRVNLAWSDNSRNEDDFYIERRLPPATFWTRIATKPADTNIYSDSTVQQSTRYAYRVQAHNGAGVSAFSNEFEVTTHPGPPVGPISLTANTLDVDKIILAWNDLANNETAYFLERKLHGDSIDFEMVAILEANTNLYIDTLLAPQTQYDYRVNCINDIGASPYSNVAIGRTASLTVFTDGFETYLTDDVPGSPWVVDERGSSTARISTRRAHNENGKSWMFRDPDAGNNGVIANRGGMNIKQASLHTWLYIPANSYFGVIGGDASANVYITWQIQFNGDASFFVRDGTGLINPGGTYPIGEWFHVEVAFSTDSSKYQVLFNDQPVTDTLGLQRTDHVPNGAVYFIAYTDQPIYDGFVDDVSMIRFYQPPEGSPRRFPSLNRPMTYIGRGPATVSEAVKSPLYVPVR